MEGGNGYWVITYMGSWSQLGGVDGIFVETIPLCKSLLGGIVISLVIPVEHIARKRLSNALAEFFDDSVRCIEEIISIDEADIDFVAGSVGMAVCSVRPIGLVLLTSDFWPHLADTAEVIEKRAELGISSFFGVEVVESRDFVQWRDRASVV